MFKEELQFIKKPITSRVKSFDDACKVLGIENNLSIVGGTNKNRQKMIIFNKMLIILEALNEGWVPDWDNGDENKWYPYYNRVNGELAFNTSNYHNSCSYCGLYLCFKSKQLSEYFGSIAEFSKLYNEFINLVNRVA